MNQQYPPAPNQPPQQPQQPQYPVQPPQGQYPTPYPPQYGQPYPQPPKTNTMAILSLVFAFLFPLLGVIFGFVALSQLKDLTKNETGKGLATAGLIVGFVFIGIALLIVIVSLATVGAAYRYY